MQKPVRIATYNVALNRPRAGELIAELAGAGSEQLTAIVQILAHIDADVLVLNELDYDEDHRALSLFAERWLAPAGLDYRYRFTGPVNTGVPSGRDLVKDGSLDNGRSSPFGFGDFPGQYGMAVLSRLPLDTQRIRTFQRFLWRDMPGANLPRQPDGEAFFDEGDLAVVRLSSKSHWDIPVRTLDGEFHLLVSHPTPPAFDGPERRNVCRNFDEIRFWSDYIDGADYMVDDNGDIGGLRDAPFVIAGDQNADPVGAGDSMTGAIFQLLSHPKTRLHTPRHESGRPQDIFVDRTETAVWGLRVDYIVPSWHWTVDASAVLWPPRDAPLGPVAERASDHRAVWAVLRMY